jgi:hypothetical protein
LFIEPPCGAGKADIKEAGTSFNALVEAETKAERRMERSYCQEREKEKISMIFWKRQRTIYLKSSNSPRRFLGDRWPER